MTRQEKENRRQDQLNRERKIYVPISYNLKAKVAGYITQSITKAIEDKESWVWIFVFALALYNDGLDILLIGSIPIIGDFLDLFTGMILTALLWNIGGYVKTKIKVVIWTAWLAETLLGILILPEFLPFWTMAMLWAYIKVSKRAELAREAQEELKQGKVNPIAMEEFSK